jgi:UDP:flavonoid glycosyltransferase YjiC (YdhE family)
VESRSPHVLLALSGHGYGHLAQAAPVVNALRTQIPGLVVSVCGSLPRKVVAARIDGEFNYRQAELDPVLRMLNAWQVDAAASQQVYRAFHRNWQAGFQSDIDLLQQLQPDLVLADIPYRILLAAAERNIPTLALCSLNWASIYRVYCDEGDEDRQIIRQINSAYRCASVFLAPRPSINMPELDNVTAIGPIARTGLRRQQSLLKKCAAGMDKRPVLVALGGIATQLPLDNWPRIDAVVWIFAEALQSGRADMVNLDSLDMRFIDVLASSDAVLTKPGYGTYAEAVCNGVPVLTIERKDWPETEFLNGWVVQHGHLEVITAAQFHSGQFARPLVRLLDKSAGAVPEPAGIAQAAALAADFLP